jgi:hypothetical protein
MEVPMAIQVASTTDTQEQVNQAAGAVQDEPEIKSTETKLEGDEQVDSHEPEEKVEPEKPKEVTPKADKYINKLTARAKSAEERAAKLEAELAEARKARPTDTVDNKDSEKPADQDNKGAETADPEPKQDDPKFKTYEDWIKAQARWEVRQERREEEQKQQKAAQEAESKRVVTSYNAEVTKFKAETPDWDEVVGGSTVQIQVGVQNALMEMARPDVVYFIASHPETAKELWAMSPARAIAEVGRIASKLEAPPVEETTNERKTGPDKLPVSSAPPPIKPLSGHSTRSSVKMDDLDYAEYRKIRDKQEKERFRR